MTPAARRGMLILAQQAFVFFIGWIMGVVLAKGFWLTFLSIIFSFYAWYLVVEKIMVFTGFGIS